MDFPLHHGVDPGDDVKVVHEIAHVLRQVLRLTALRPEHIYF